MSKALTAANSSKLHACRPLAVAGAFIALAMVGSTPVLAEPKGDVVLALPNLVQTFDPTTMNATAPTMIFDFVYDGLINLGRDGKYPALAESWVVSEDGKQVDFSLRKGVKFHNGDPFTAEDVKFTFEKVMAPDSGHIYRGGFAQSIERIEVVDPHTVRFVLKNPWPSFFTTARYALQPIIPKAYYETVGAKGFQDKPVGTGPFRLVALQAGEMTKYEANVEYWGGAPTVKTATQRLVKEPFTRYAMLERGEADIVTGLTGPLLERLRGNKDYSIVLSRYSGTSGILFNKETFPQAADRRVRLAIGHAINRQEIADKVQGGICEPATGMFTPGTFGYLDGLPQIPYDPAKAKAMLEEAGVKPGTRISFTLQTDSFPAVPNAPQVLEAIAGNLEAVGFVVERESFDTGAWLAMMRSKKRTSIFYSPSSIPDDGGETINTWFTSGSFWPAGNINRPEYDELFRKQLRTSDLEERKKILQDFARLEAENLENVPLLWCHTPFASSNKRIADWSPALGSGYHTSIRLLRLK